MRTVRTTRTRTRNGLSCAVIAAMLAMFPLTASMATAQQSENHEAGLKAAEQMSQAFEHAANEIKQSVVAISSRRRVTTGGNASQIPEQFRRFFGEDFFENFGPFQNPGEGFVQQGMGTGFIVSEDGYILTNNHVVEDADEVTVVTHDQRRYDAEIVGTDPRTDVAVLKIEAEPLKPAKLGDSDNLRVGRWVIAVGSPFGLQSTITAGIVSATGRSRVGIADYEDFIQTDAAINPGNSGGPLVNLRGEVVGMNAAIFTRTGGAMGVGFAIPINMAKDVMNSLIEDGRVVRGFLGVVIRDMTQGLARSFGYDSTEGALVEQVQSGSPAEQAGLQRGDIITHFNGKRVQDVDGLRFDVANTKPGTEAAVTIFREGETRRLTVEIGELEQEEQTAERDESESRLNLGMQYRTLTPEIARRLGYDEPIEGVIVAGVQPLSPADDAGLQPRDIIVSVQGQRVRNAREFENAIREANLSDGVRLSIRRGDMQRFVFIESDE